MAGGLFVFVRTAPPGGCALAITAGQYRPPMAHGPLSEKLEGALSCLYGPRDVVAELPSNGIHISELLFGARAFPVAFPRYL